MFCVLCESVKRLSHGVLAPGPGGVTRAPAPEGTCERCGRPLERDSFERLAAKVDQLARFGLTGRPLLSRRRI